MNPNKLNWKKVKLTEVGTIESGGTPSTKVMEYWGDKISWITPSDLSGYSNKYISKGKKSLTELGLLNSSAKIVPKGSILFSSRAPIGYVIIAHNRNEVCTNQGFKNLIPSKYIYTDYIYHYLISAKQIAEKLASGTTFKEISAKGFAKIPFPLPPLAEQQEIVKRLEELFSRLDKAVETLKKIRNQLKTYRQAVLKHAFEGKLTEKWRKKNKPEPAARLLEQIKEEREKEYRNKLKEWEKASKKAKANGKKAPPKPKKVKELPPLSEEDLAKLPELSDGWEWTYFSYCGYWNGGGTPSKQSKDYWNNGNIFWVSPKDMKNKIINDTIDKITSLGVENSNVKIIEPYSILYVVRSGILRRIFPVSVTKCNVTVNQDLQALTPILIDSFFIYWYSIFANEDIRMTCSKDGTTVESINTELLKNYPFPLPTLPEQSVIVSEIESRFSVADKLEEAIDSSLKKSEALRQSILQKAFSGQLTTKWRAENPELISGENSAEALLKKIKEEKKKMEEKMKRKKEKSPQRTRR